MNQNKNKGDLHIEMSEVEQLTECLFALNRSVNALKSAIQNLNDSSLSDSAKVPNAVDPITDPEEVARLTPKPTLH